MSTMEHEQQFSPEEFAALEEEIATLYKSLREAQVKIGKDVYATERTCLLLIKSFTSFCNQVNELKTVEDIEPLKQVSNENLKILAHIRDLELTKLDVGNHLKALEVNKATN